MASSTHSAPISPLIDLAELKEQSGNTSFAKGLQLASQQRVQQLECKGGTITALVQGTRPYRVKLQVGKSLRCDCTCPAAEYQEVCKHAVATALTFNMQAQERGKEPGNTGATSDGELLRRYFDRQDKAVLLTLLLEELGHNDSRWRYWVNKARLSEQKMTPATLKKLINQALPKSSLWNWHEVADYFEEAGTLFESVWEGLAPLPARDQWNLLNHAISRLNLVLEQIDDSGGYRLDIEAELIDRLPKLFHQLPWSEAERAAWLFECLVEEQKDIFPDSREFGETYASPHFLALCEQGLEKKLTDPHNNPDWKWEARRYSEPLIAAARARGDWHTELSIQSRLAENTHEWLSLCQLCLDHQEALDAEFWLAKARKQASSPFDQGKCDRLAIQIYEQLGDKSQAWRLGNQIFVQNPSFEAFQTLRQLQQRLAWQDEGLLTRVEAALKTARASEPMEYYATPGQDALLNFYLDQGREEDACLWATDHKVSNKALLTLAERIVMHRPLDALTYYFRAATATVELGNNEAYQEAVDLLHKLAGTLAGNDPMLTLFDQHLNGLITKHKRKRNFIQLVNQHFQGKLP